MKPILYLALCFSLHAMAQTHFQYHPSVLGDDGAEAAFVTFKAENREIRYVPPADWGISDGHFRPGGEITADVWIDTSPLPAPVQWNEEHIQQIRDWVLTGFIPKQSRNITIVSEELNPLKIGGLATFEITVSYDFFGLDRQTSILFVNRGKTDFRFICAARKQNFEALHSSFRGSLFSVDGI